MQRPSPPSAAPWRGVSDKVIGRHSSISPKFFSESGTGVPQDHIQANFWTSLAASNDDTEATRKLESWPGSTGKARHSPSSGQAAAKTQCRGAASLLQEAGLRASELCGSEQRDTQAAFRRARDWFRAPQVDTLNKDEAVVIATKLVSRLAQRLDLMADQEARLTETLPYACVQILTETVEK